MTLTPKHRDKIQAAGKNLALIEQQIQHFISDFPPMNILKPARIGEGIFKTTEAGEETLISYYDSQSKSKDIVKFVPASGAASRMFKDLFAFLEEENATLDKHPAVAKFIQQIKNFAFYEALDQVLNQKGTSLQAALEQKNYKGILSALLLQDGLNYGALPKALLAFHQQGSDVYTPIHEHFSEGVAYAVGKDKRVKIHFTVTPEHQALFEKLVNQLIDTYKKNSVHHFEVSFSQQKPETDTIAVNADNTPFIEADGSLLFRPAGHGALLENLNDIEADIIFIKNIDNVVPERIRAATTRYKKIIGAVLLQVQERVFSYLQQLTTELSDATLADITLYAEKELNIRFPEHYASMDKKAKQAWLYKQLNRPIRVCGMVPNTGEPGGGPFWVKDEQGNVSLQIVETSQMDLQEPITKQAVAASTHFNPVDLVCGVKDYQGNKFDLRKYRDPNTGFITEKSKNGKILKAQELPGLWNGAMAHWITLFVEVPLITFNPVKTVNDLLRVEHQG